MFLQQLKKGQKSFTKAFLRLFAVLLIFGGPTYLLYILDKLNIPRLIILVVGLAALIAGIILYAYLSEGEEKVGGGTEEKARSIGTISKDHHGEGTEDHRTEKRDGKAEKTDQGVDTQHSIIPTFQYSTIPIFRL